MQSSWKHIEREWRQKRTIVFALTLGNWQLLWPLFILLLTAFSQFVSSRCPRISQYFAKVCKFVPVMVSEPNFPRIVHCSNTACSLPVHFFTCTCLQAQTQVSSLRPSLIRQWLFQYYWIERNGLKRNQWLSLGLQERKSRWKRRRRWQQCICFWCNHAVFLGKSQRIPKYSIPYTVSAKPYLQ